MTWFWNWLAELSGGVGGDDPSGPWPATDEERSMGLWP